MILDEKDSNYRQCTISIMDNIADPNIYFDENGISNYYYYYQKVISRLPSPLLRNKRFTEIIELLKLRGKGKAYDCIIGVSGGVDSSYLCYLAYKAGLRVLCVHFDNGWNSELAVYNINQIVHLCNFDLYTYVINWEEFRDIQLAFFKSHVIDIEAITDIAIFDALNMICGEKKIGYILDGRNIATECILPGAWINKNPNNLFDIHRKHGELELKEYPAKFKNGRYIFPKGRYESFPLLNYVEYNKTEAKKIIMQDLGWRDYGGKHYESVFTRFYQGFILPQKFKVDKRKAHLSNLIFSGQMTKADALQELKEPIYPSDLFLQDREFVLKKLGLSMQEFESYLNHPPISHDNYFNQPPIKKEPLSVKIKNSIGGILHKFKSFFIN